MIDPSVRFHFHYARIPLVPQAQSSDADPASVSTDWATTSDQQSLELEDPGRVSLEEFSCLSYNSSGKLFLVEI